ncbi:Molybdopterin synthase catalytic subunit MoaE [hydrothermal vent metagenome]|uniref:Molybdopterin synthase catalytic subunit MoaE n=1 Tax=hydrothermal vent metagenome TaxID=652676 RepID=A0A3B1AQJ9_9ZZZZ
MHIELLPDSFNALRKLEQYQTSLSQSGEYGAMSNFIGTMRNINESKDIVEMFLEHYPGMTEKSLTNIVHTAEQQWKIIDSLLVHRIGNIQPNDSIVLVAVWSAHRVDAFEACRYIMEQLKSTAPFWKRETTKNSHHWVEKNTPGK